MSKGTRRRYSDEFKADSVKLMAEQGYSVAEASRRLGIDRSVLARWRREAGELPQRSGKLDREDERDSELRRLRDEVRKLRIEKDILKNPRGPLVLPEDEKLGASLHYACAPRGVAVCALVA